MEQTMTDASQPGSDRGYEFTAQQNQTIGRTGSRARWWGVLMLLFGLLFAALGLFAMIADGVFDFSGVMIWAAIAMIPVYIGTQFVRAARSLDTVVSTEGNDVEHLMDAVGSLGSALLAQVVSMSVWILLMVAAVLITVGQANNTRDKAYVAVQKSDLRNLATAQEIYYANSGGNGADYTYASSIAELDFQASAGVTVTLLAGGSAGWSARTEHSALPEMGCALYFGDMPAPSTASGTETTQPGEVVCDGS
jgi:hypothetical protein